MTYNHSSTELALLEINEDIPFDEALAKGIEFHNLAVRGEKTATKLAIGWLERARQLRPESPEAEAYYGSSLALVGRDSIDPQERFARVLQGIKLLDEVVDAHQEEVTVRIVRAYVNYRLPEVYFHRTQVAINDFSFLIAQYEKDNSVFAQELYWRLLFDLGKAHMNIGNEGAALATWHRLAALGPNRTVQRALRAEGIEIEGFEEEPVEVARRDAVLKEGKRLLHLGEAGDVAAAQKAHEIFSEAHSTWSEDPTITGLYSSSLSLMGRYAPEGGTMFSQAIQAIAMMEEAIRKDPTSIELRRIRAAHSYRLPEQFFFRTTTAITDLTYLASQYESGSTEIDAGEYRKILYCLGDSYLRLGMLLEAKDTWERLLTLDSNSPYAQTIRTQLDKALPKEPIALPQVEALPDLLQLGIRLHNQAIDDDPQAAEAARACLEKAHQLNPKDPLIEAYYGSAVALTGRCSRNSSTMFGNAVQGLMLINNALRRRPKNPTIRLLRGYLCYSLPEPLFHLTTIAVEDFEFVKQWYQGARTNKKKAEVLTPAEFATMLLDLEKAYRRIGEATKADAVAQEINP